MDESYDISITGVSYDLVAHNLQEDIKSKGEEKARGRGKTWYFTGLTKAEADALTIGLTDAAANINYISTSDNTNYGGSHPPQGRREGPVRNLGTASCYCTRRDRPSVSTGR